MRKLLVLLLAVMFTLSFSSISFAGGNETVKGMGHKLQRGVTNVGTGWGELFKEMHATGKENLFLGLTYGPIKGAGKTVVRTAAGGLETGTFLFPAPKGYHEPLVEPEYIF